MDYDKVKEQVLQPEVVAVMVVALVAGVFSTQYVMDNYVVDKPAFNETEVINQGVQLAGNSTHTLHAKCQGNYTAMNITQNNVNSTWVVDNCWFTTQERTENLNETNEFQLG